MPSEDFKYRQYKIDKKFKQLRDAEKDPLQEPDYQPKKPFERKKPVVKIYNKMGGHLVQRDPYKNIFIYEGKHDPIKEEPEEDESWTYYSEAEEEQEHE